jgi:mannitol/fructose-specific phosphotransferase system IIA component (Ntr-type)
MSEISKAGTGKIAELLSADKINLNIQATAKPRALREVASLLAQDKCIGDFEAFYREILDRERVSNTALGHDIAIPHARTDQCSNIVIAVGRSAPGIDFEAKDGRPVRLIFLIGTPKAMVSDYLRIVGNLARLLRQDELRQRLLDVPDAAAFIKVIEEAET